MKNIDKQFEKNMAKNELINELLDVIGGDENAPIQFKVLRAEKKVHDKTMKMLLDKKIGDKQEDKLLSLISYFEQGIKIIEDIVDIDESEE